MRQHIRKLEEEENDDSTALSAHSKEIYQFMNASGLTKENVSSHLQKYRLTLKTEQDAIQEKTIMARPAESGLAPYNILPFPPLNLQEGHLFSNLKTALELPLSTMRKSVEELGPTRTDATWPAQLLGSIDLALSLMACAARLRSLAPDG
ncbi:hypothetical protein L484_003700 [Morus notabilis]|uniref:HTH myb-type domain-containing protein n=1 Tax=Morus notabilis TaxID=981085 RepID=W9RBX2_9ROSA|nr:hypothetical protein L484_003700 [Morus notabilis]